MTAQTLPNVGIKSGYLDNELGWGSDMNQNLRLLDAILQLRVLDKDLTAPPGSPVAGACYIVAASPTGAWAGHAGHIAIYRVGDDLSSSWAFVVPKVGWQAWVNDESLDYRFFGGVWTPIAAGGSAVGITWNARTSTYEIAASDAGNGIAMSSSSPNIVRVMNYATAPIEIGNSVMVYQEGTGLTTIEAGGGVTIVKRGTSLALGGQYAVAMLTKRATNTWILTGDIAA